MTKTERTAEAARLLAQAIEVKKHAAQYETSDPILASSERARAARLMRRAIALKNGR